MEKYSLKWSDFRSDFAGGFQDLLQEEAMVDVTLAVEGQFLQAHKLVLSVCSPYFKSLFKVNPCRHPIVILKDVNYKILNYMLGFMYKGEVGIEPDDLPSFLSLAEALKVKGLDSENLQPSQHSGRRRSAVSRVRRKRKAMKSESDEDDNDDDEPKEKPDRRQSKLRLRSSPRNVSKLAVSQSKKRHKTESNELEDDDEDSDCPLGKLIMGSVESADKKLKAPVDSSDDDDRGNEDFDMSGDFPSGETSENSEQVPQELLSTLDIRTAGGVDYQMIQTKRGRDMLLYDGFTYTQNRMCKDGMRWQCSYAKCKAFCRMSSAGWLTPYKTNHDHNRPPEHEIRRRILRMELKARAQSSGATPGEIIRNALPAEEYQTTDQRACYTRCIQRFRKSLQRKTKTDNSWSNVQDVDLGGSKDIPETAMNQDPPWVTGTKPHLSAKEEPKPHPLVEGMWSSHPQPVLLSEEEKLRQLAEQKDNVHIKIGAYAM